MAAAQQTGIGAKTWLPVAVLGALAVLAGLAAPYLLNARDGVSRDNPSATSGDSGAGGKLAYTPPAWPEPANHQAMFFRLLIGTISVLGLCAGTLWFCKRWLSPMAQRNQVPGAQLKLVESLGLGSRCTVHLVHVGARLVLVGVDSSGVKTIVPMPDSFAAALQETQEGNGFAEASSVADGA